MKFFKQNMFLFRPSIFHVMHVRLILGLSEHWSVLVEIGLDLAQVGDSKDD